MGVWQGVAMDFLKYYPGLPCPSLLRPGVGQTTTPKTVIRPFSGMAHPQGSQQAVFYLFGHPMPHAYEETLKLPYCY